MWLVRDGGNEPNPGTVLVWSAVDHGYEPGSGSLPPSLTNHIGDVMASVLVWSAVDHGYEPGSVHCLHPLLTTFIAPLGLFTLIP
jgi:hypothetical protein